MCGWHILSTDVIVAESWVCTVAAQDIGLFLVVSQLSAGGLGLVRPGFVCQASFVRMWGWVSAASHTCAGVVLVMLGGTGPVHTVGGQLGLGLGWSPARTHRFARWTGTPPTSLMVTLLAQLHWACHLRRHHGCLPQLGRWHAVAEFLLLVTFDITMVGLLEGFPALCCVGRVSGWGPPLHGSS